jgi:hypothetical protein
MSNRLRQCLRVAQVRSIEHTVAAHTSALAARRVEALEMSDQQLARLRAGFRAEHGVSSGAILAGLGELAMRLDIAREGLRRSITGAREQAANSAELQIEARRREESMKKLAERAAAEAARAAEQMPLPVRGGRRSLPTKEPHS